MTQPTPDKRFCYTILKIVVSFVVAVVTVTFCLIRMILRLVVDILGQAKDATPGVTEELKAHARVVGAHAPEISSKVNSDLRKAFKVKRLHLVSNEADEKVA